MVVVASDDLFPWFLYVPLVVSKIERLYSSPHDIDEQHLMAEMDSECSSKNIHIINVCTNDHLNFYLNVHLNVHQSQYMS